MRRKPPTTVTVLGILNLIFGIGVPPHGILCTVCGGFGLGTMWVLSTREGNDDISRALAEVWRAFQDVPGYVPIEVSRLVLELGLGVLLICSGAGLLKLRPWARPTAIIFSILTIVIQLAYTIYVVTMVNPALEGLQARMAAMPGQQANPFQGMSNTLMTVFGAIFGIAYAVVLLAFMLSPTVVAALKPPPPEEYSAQPDMPPDDPDAPPPPWPTTGIRPERRDQPPRQED